MSAVMEKAKRRPSWSSNGAESIGGHQLSTSVAQRSASVSFLPQNGEALAAARWQMFEKVASELMDDFDTERYTRTADIYERWAQREAELNKSDDAKHCHSVAVACRQRVELIRRYPGEFTDTMAVLADIFTERHEPAGGAHVNAA